jgi:hypothetical protein
MQKVILRSDPVFMLVSACSAASGDSLETQKCCVTRSSSQRPPRKGEHTNWGWGLEASEAGFLPGESGFALRLHEAAGFFRHLVGLPRFSKAGVDSAELVVGVAIGRSEAEDAFELGLGLGHAVGLEIELAKLVMGFDDVGTETDGVGESGFGLGDVSKAE